MEFNEYQMAAERTARAVAGEGKVLYFTFENEKSLVDFLEENYRW
jgi:hypothetical protein